MMVNYFEGLSFEYNLKQSSLLWGEEEILDADGYVIYCEI